MQTHKCIIKRGFSQAFTFWVTLLILVLAILPLSGCGFGEANPYIPGITSPRYTDLGYGTLFLRDGSTVTGSFRLNNKNQSYEKIASHGEHLHWSYATAPVLGVYPVYSVDRFER